MLSLSATATQGVKGWNLTTEGTPGFLFRNIWSSSLVTPARDARTRLPHHIPVTLSVAWSEKGDRTEGSRAQAWLHSASSVKLLSCAQQPSVMLSPVQVCPLLTSDPGADGFRAKLTQQGQAGDSYAGAGTVCPILTSQGRCPSGSFRLQSGPGEVTQVKGVSVR